MLVLSRKCGEKVVIGEGITVTVLAVEGGRIRLGIEAPDDRTVIFHMKEPDSGLPWNLSDGAMGIVPSGSDKTFSLHLVGSGPFKFVKNEQDNEVVIVRTRSRRAGVRGGYRALSHGAPCRGRSLRPRVGAGSCRGATG